MSKSLIQRPVGTGGNIKSMATPHGYFQSGSLADQLRHEIGSPAASLAEGDDELDVRKANQVLSRATFDVPFDSHKQFWAAVARSIPRDFEVEKPVMHGSGSLSVPLTTKKGEPTGYELQLVWNTWTRDSLQGKGLQTTVFGDAAITGN